MKRVLVIDDECLLRRLYQRILSDKFAVDTIPQYKGFEDTKYDIYLIDYRLKNENGYQVGAKIRLKHGDDVKLVMMSSNLPEFDIDSVFDCKFTKGKLSNDDLVSKLEKLTQE